MAATTPDETDRLDSEITALINGEPPRAHISSPTYVGLVCWYVFLTVLWPVSGSVLWIRDLWKGNTG